MPKMPGARLPYVGGKPIPRHLMARAVAAHRHANATRNAMGRLRSVRPGRFASGGPFAAGGRTTLNNIDSANRTFRNIGRTPRAIPPPPPTNRSLARAGRDAAAWVRKPSRIAAIGLGLGVTGAIVNNSGRATDKTVGRPTGMYRY